MVGGSVEDCFEWALGLGSVGVTDVVSLGLVLPTFGAAVIYPPGGCSVRGNEETTAQSVILKQMLSSVGIGHSEGQDPRCRLCHGGANWESDAVE